MQQPRATSTSSRTHAMVTRTTRVSSCIDRPVTRIGGSTRQVYKGIHQKARASFTSSSTHELISKDLRNLSTMKCIVVSTHYVSNIRSRSSMMGLCSNFFIKLRTYNYYRNVTINHSITFKRLFRAIQFLCNNLSLKEANKTNG